MTAEMLERMEEHIKKLQGNLNHGRRVLLLSTQIAQEEGISYDEDVLSFCAYFHDVAAYPPYAPQGPFDHALESSKIVVGLAREYGFNEEQIETIVEAVKYHDKANMGNRAETRLLRNADGLDYLGYMAVARDFQKFPGDMKKAVAALRRRTEQFYSIIDLPCALQAAAPRVNELTHFLARFEEESCGIY